MEAEIKKEFTMNNIAENLSFYRKKNNLTQTQLGELLHVSAQAISKWETGQAEPGLDMILKLAEIYGITTDELLSFTPTSAPAESAPAPVAPKKPNAFAAWLKKFWFIPVIVLVLAAALATTLVLLKQPPNYGKMIKNGEIALGMTKAEIVELLGTPTDTWTSKGYPEALIVDSTRYPYANSDYFTYFDMRDPENDQELWFGIEYTFCRLVFNESGTLIEAFFRNTPDTEVYDYGDVGKLFLEEYTALTYANGQKNGCGMLIFSDGSVYLGTVKEDRRGGKLTELQTAMGDFTAESSLKINTGSTGNSGKLG